ncbi:Uncharacterised protein [Serratia quinivorans]|nr:Uncharacterised protein [Serratia quinivorans]
MLYYNITKISLTQALSQRIMQLNVTRNVLLSLAIHRFDNVSATSSGIYREISGLLIDKQR